MASEGKPHKYISACFSRLKAAADKLRGTLGTWKRVMGEYPANEELEKAFFNNNPNHGSFRKGAAYSVAAGEKAEDLYDTLIADGSATPPKGIVYNSENDGFYHPGHEKMKLGLVGGESLSFIPRDEPMTVTCDFFEWDGERYVAHGVRILKKVEGKD